MEQKSSADKIELKYRLIEYSLKHNSFEQILPVIYMPDEIKTEFLKARKQLIALKEYDTYKEDN